jgi:tetratricopeptide (TPR) repeat protein
MSEGSENVHGVARRQFFFKWGRRAAYTALVALLAFGGVCTYSVVHRRHLAKQLELFVAKGDFQSAVLVARRLLVQDENNLTACRAMAEMAEKTGRPEAVLWRKKIAQASPNVAADQIALARAALRFGHADLAEAVLKALPENARGSVQYHQVAGAEALARKQMASAENHFSEAVRLAPDDPHLALNLAIIQLTSSDSAVVESARKSVVQLAENAAVRSESLRTLTTDALANHNKAQAQKWATQLNAESGSSFADSFLYFQAVEGTDAAPAALEQLRAKAAASPRETAELITWLNRQGLGQVALHWASTLPAQITNAHPVPLAVAESYSFLQDWNGLRDFVEGKNWGEVDALRLAVQSHALHRLGPADRPSMQAQTVWASALQAAQNRPEQLLAIAQLAEGWGYHAEAEEAWWKLANSSERGKTALAALQRLYKTKQDTHGLLRVAKRALELNPNDLVAANNCANLGLLLNSDSTARRLATKLHSEHPTNGVFAATYAFALHTEGKSAEGLRVMESLKEEELRDPTIAAYYVVMLVDSGNLERARSFLANAERASLLPEERQLLSSAARRLL